MKDLFSLLLAFLACLTGAVAIGGTLALGNTIFVLVLWAAAFGCAIGALILTPSSTGSSVSQR